MFRIRLLAVCKELLSTLFTRFSHISQNDSGADFAKALTLTIIINKSLCSPLLIVYKSRKDACMHALNLTIVALPAHVAFFVFRVREQVGTTLQSAM